jgi:hypothetical protein
VEVVIPVTATSEPPAIGKIGERVERYGIALTVEKITTSTRISNFSPPNKGNVYLIIAVALENTQKEEANYNSFYFSIKDNNGFEYNLTPIYPEPPLQSGKLANGAVTKGNISFEVRQDAKGLILTYQPKGLSGSFDPIRINLNTAIIP